MSDESAELPGVMNIALPAIKAGIDLFRNAVRLAKEVKELLRVGAKKDAFDKSPAETDKESKVAQAQIAQTLGFQLCQCAFPPSIMTSKGYHLRHDEEVFECPSCKKQSPTQRHFDGLDRRDARRAKSSDRRHENRFGGSR